MSVAKVVGRPPRNGEATSRHIKARVTDSEFQKITADAQKEHSSVADYIRVRLGLRVL